MNNAFAAIDLGTNTFHLLIAAGKGTSYQEIIRRVDPVKLGEGGITKGTITAPAFERGIDMLREYASHCKEHKVKHISAIGTSALRSAANGSEFVRKALQEAGIRISIIDGDDEARLIYKGVRLSGCLSVGPSLIVDIGGGSVEFIFCDNDIIFWKQSFEIGAARLMAKFHQLDPLTDDALNDLYLYLDKQLSPLFEWTQSGSVSQLVGSAGAFESFAALIDTNFDPVKQVSFAFKREELLDTLIWLETSSHQQRVQTGRIIPVRIDMIVSAAAVSHYLIERLAIPQVSMTTYSLKEGLMEELMQAES